MNHETSLFAYSFDQTQSVPNAFSLRVGMLPEFAEPQKAANQSNERSTSANRGPSRFGDATVGDFRETQRNDSLPVGGNR